MGKTKNRNKITDKLNNSIHIRPTNNLVITKAKSDHQHTLKAKKKAKKEGEREDLRPSNLKYPYLDPRRNLKPLKKPDTSFFQPQRSISPIRDQDGNVLSNEEQRNYYRSKANQLEFRFAKDDKIISPSLKTTNILAMAAGLVANDLEESSEPAIPVQRKPSNPTLPNIILEDIEDGEIVDEDGEIFILKPKTNPPNKNKRKRQKKKMKQQEQQRKVAEERMLVRRLSTLQTNNISSKPPTRIPVPVIVLSDSEPDSDVIILDDKDDEEEGRSSQLIATTTQQVNKRRTTTLVGTSTTTTAVRNEVVQEIRFETSKPSIVTSKQNFTSSIPSQASSNMPPTRIARHIRIPTSPSGLLRLNDYIDSLSFYIAKNMGIHFRGPQLACLSPPSEGLNMSKVFRVITYNVLCQETMVNHMHLYPHLTIFPQLCDWGFRWSILAPELDALKGDIYCLQEVEKCQSRDFYDELFLNRKRFVGFSYFRDNDCPDGCAIYWNPAKFSALETFNIPFNYRVNGLDKPNVAQICRLCHLYTGKTLMVVNTHILFNPNRGDIKLYQLAVLFANIHKVRKDNEPVIFCGDLNLEPYSQLYNFIMNGYLDCMEEPCIPNTMSGQFKRSNNDPITSFLIPPATQVANDCTFNGAEHGQSQRITHPFNWHTAYTHMTCKQQPEVSTYHQSKGNPDFIFYTVKEKTVFPNHIDVVEDGLHLLKRLLLPDADALRRYSDKLPHPYTGSDHLPLVAEFSLS